MLMRLPLVLTFAMTVAGIAPVHSVQAQAAPSNPPHAPHVPQRPTPERMAADRSLLNHVSRALSLSNVGFARRDTVFELQLENWKRSLSIDTIAPIAHRGLAVMLRQDSAARKAKMVSARFSDYEPQLVTLSWTMADFKAHPERVRVTRSKK
jgi:hypothetical protein